MNINKQFITITRFSKMVAMTLFLLLPFVGFCLGVEYQKNLSIFTSINTTTMPLHILDTFTNPGWAGHYTFMESASPDEFWNYDLQLGDPDNKEVGLLIVTGFQTNLHMNLSTQKTDGQLDVYFDRKSDGNWKKIPYIKGDLLFSLRPLNVTDFLIIWNKMQPNIKSERSIFKFDPLSAPLKGKIYE